MSNIPIQDVIIDKKGQFCQNHHLAIAIYTYDLYGVILSILAAVFYYEKIENNFNFFLDMGHLVLVWS